MSVAVILAKIEDELTQVVEGRLAGHLPEALAGAAVQGCLLKLPEPAAPQHVLVLTALRNWKDTALIMPESHQMLHDRIVAASRPKAAAPPPAPAEAALANAPAAASSKKQKLEKGQKTLKSMGMMQRYTSKNELLVQRQAAGRHEDYTPSSVDLGTDGTFPSAKDDAKPQLAPGQRIYACPKCARVFTTHIGLRNHVSTHDDAVRPKSFYTPRPPPTTSVEFNIRDDGLVDVNLLIDGLAISEHEAAAAAAATAAAAAAAASEAQRAERAKRLKAEGKARALKRERDAAAEVEAKTDD